MKKFLFLILPALMAFGFVSCEEDFDINAPYQDITVVYGLLDQGDDSIFLKINKAFLGEGNVLEMAKIQDSSIYVTGLLAVIEEWNGNDLFKSYTLETITLDNKDSGIFYNPYQIVYSTPYDPNQDMEYRLKITIGEKEVTAATHLVSDFSITRPSAGSKFIQFKPDTDDEVKWNSAAYGRRYEVIMRIKYKEVLFDDPDTVFKYIDWGLGIKKSKDTDGGEEMYVLYNNNSFYTIIKDRIPYDDSQNEANVKERFTNDVDVIISVAEEDLNTYIEVNEPSNSIVQDKPEYTNITNGIGIFSSRFKNIRTKKIGLETIQDIKELAPELKFVF
jgi:hypothetical protein